MKNLNDMTKEELVELVVVTTELKENLIHLNELLNNCIGKQNNNSIKINSKRLDLNDILMNCGIKPNLSGFKYILDSIEYIKNNDDFSMTKDLYPAVAVKNNTTPSRVERAIGHAIELAGKKKNDFYCTYFGSDDKMTNSEFLSVFTLKFK